MAALFIRKSIRQKAYLFEKRGCDQARPSIRTRIDARCRREESGKDHARNMKPLEVDAGKQLIIESCVQEAAWEENALQPSMGLHAVVVDSILS